MPVVYLAAGLLFLWPVLIGGYYLANKELLSPALLLTLFQTNGDEALSYLLMQDRLMWGIGLIFVLAALYAFFRIARKYPDSHCSSKRLAGLFILVFLLGIRLGAAAQDGYAFKLVSMTCAELGNYREYGRAKALREERLRNLSGLSVKDTHKGIYMLVIGESETRDHMSLYGYGRETTPWLETFYREPGTLVFKNACSNHTHTVPVLTYSLSEKNQYNKKELKEACSLMEAAKAAGYKTYWISNQLQFGAWDTPVAEIASTADVQKWMNQNVGKTTQTFYFDGKLADEIPDLTGEENALIVVHLMGCHGWYGDRYPKDYGRFRGGDNFVDAYDNSVLYNDAVLKQLNEKFNSLSNAKAWIYFSDHGEDADTRKGHDASRFTPEMSHIPLVIQFTEAYRNENKKIIDGLESHLDAYWTNDLLYDLMISLLGIQGLPTETQLDLSSEAYDRTKENTLTLHGKRKLSQE